MACFSLEEKTDLNLNLKMFHLLCKTNALMVLEVHVLKLRSFVIVSTSGLQKEKKCIMHPRGSCACSTKSDKVPEHQ